MRFPLGPCVLLALFAASAGQALAQQGRTALLAGYGGIDHEASLGPAFHLNLRRELLHWKSVPLSPPGPRQAVLPGFALHAELFAQRGRSGTRVGPCGPSPDQLCAHSADPLYLLGAGLASRADLTSAARPVGLYFIPLSVGVYVRGYHLHERPLGAPSGEAREELRLAGGIGNGIGVRLRIGGVQGLLELRAALIRDLQGGRGGTLPVSVGLVW